MHQHKCRTDLVNSITWPGDGDVAQLAEHWTDTLQTLVRFPGAARDFSPSQLSVQTPLRCLHTPWVQSCALTSVHTLLVDYGSPKSPSMHCALNSVTLSQLAFPGESNPNFCGRNPIGTIWPRKCACWNMHYQSCRHYHRISTAHLFTWIVCTIYTCSFLPIRKKSSEHPSTFGSRLTQYPRNLAEMTTWAAFILRYSLRRYQPRQIFWMRVAR